MSMATWLSSKRVVLSNAFSGHWQNMKAAACIFCRSKSNDELGLVQRSIETSVQVEVEPIQLAWWEKLLGAERTPIYAGMLLAGITLIVVLSVAGRKTALAIGRKRKVQPGR
jgi:hypothetical protein